MGNLKRAMLGRVNHVEGKPGLVGLPTIYHWNLIRQAFMIIMLTHHLKVESDQGQGFPWGPACQQKISWTKVSLCGGRNPLDGKQLSAGGSP